MSLKSKITKFLKKLNIAILKYETLEFFQRSSQIERERIFDFLTEMQDKDIVKIINHLKKSTSQFGQDLFVLAHKNFKEKGFFVEFGATNGVELSNTYLMETQFGWEGILAEPARCWHEELKKNRKGYIETRCVWKESDKSINFLETDHQELSTIGSFQGFDINSKNRNKFKSYSVQTISLEDLLKKYNAPYYIDYLSIDTEGSEFDILQNFNFSKYRIDIITCEHNYSKSRNDIYNLLIQNGYVRVYENLSKVDDWYLKLT